MEPLGRILSRLPIRGPGPVQSRQIHAVLERVVGPEQARQVRIGSLRRGVLVLEVPSSSLAFEWQAFRRDELLKEFQADLSLRHIKEVRTRVGSWRDHVG